MISAKDILRGALIYVSGDTVASLILHEFMWSRFLGIMVIGATVYAFEIPNYFRWIDSKVTNLKGFRQSPHPRPLSIVERGAPGKELTGSGIYHSRVVLDFLGIKLIKTGLAILYFNPLWIARHLLFIQLFSGQWHAISWDILRIASWSFLVNIPLSLIANYLIQNMINLKYRFMASALFSAFMAVWYAVSKTLFTH